jgi:hypothetical protein
VTLTDTGPLVALIDARDRYHAQIVASLSTVAWPLVTTEACLTEALYLLNAAAGWPGQKAPWQFVEDGGLRVLETPQNGPLGAKAYMEQFRDQPCDYADATLLVAAEETGLRRIFTIDRHFYAYRLTGGVALDVIPG